MSRIYLTSTQGARKEVEVDFAKPCSELFAAASNLFNYEDETIRLLYQGQSLDRNTPMSKYGLFSGCTVKADGTLRVVEYPLTIQTSDGKSVVMTVRDETRVGEVYKFAQRELGLAQNSFTLQCNGNPLYATHTAKFAGLTQGPTVYVIPK